MRVFINTPGRCRLQEVNEPNPNTIINDVR